MFTSLPESSTVVAITSLFLFFTVILTTGKKHLGGPQAVLTELALTLSLRVAGIDDVTKLFFTWLCSVV